jgi:hypothetical protein
MIGRFATLRTSKHQNYDPKNNKKKKNPTIDLYSLLTQGLNETYYQKFRAIRFCAFFTIVLNVVVACPIFFYKKMIPELFKHLT